MGILFEPAYRPRFDFEEYTKEVERSSPHTFFPREEKEQLENLAKEHTECQPHILGKWKTKKNRELYATAYGGELYFCFPDGYIF